MKRIVYTCCLLLVLAAACSRGGAEQMLETARFEELQNNRAHARELYEAIIRDYPQSQQAHAARERLAALGEGD